MAVSVLPGTQLARMQDHTVEDIAGRAPGVTFSQNTGRAQITIRGIGTNAVPPGPIRVRPCISMAYTWPGRPWCSPIFWISTGSKYFAALRGRSMAGTASAAPSIWSAEHRRATRKPRSVWAAEATAPFVSTRACSGPIIPGRLMGSGAILRGVRTGTVRDLNHPDHPLGGEDVIGARGQLRVVLNRRTELRIAGDLTHSDPAPLYYSKILAVKPGFQVDNPADLHDVRASFPAEGQHVPVRRVGPPHCGPHAVHSSDEPDGLPRRRFRSLWPIQTFRNSI